MIPSDRDLERWAYDHLGMESFHPGFDRLNAYLDPIRIEIRKRAIRIVTIGGTNGKGETSYRVSSLLQHRGVPHALWISPHIRTIRERLSMNGDMIRTDECWRRMNELHEDVCRRGIELSYYEFFFVLFLRYALDEGAQVLVLEVGLGGRLDGVNALDADVAAITSLSRDHQAILGRTYRDILSEKLPIARLGKKLVTGLELAYCREIVCEYAQSQQIMWCDVFDDATVSVNTPFSERNHAVALAIIRALFPDKELNTPYFRLDLPARGETLCVGMAECLCYGTHNPDGMRKLVHFLRQDSYTFDQILCAFSERPLSDVRTMVATLSMVQDRQRGECPVVLTSFSHPKAMPLSRVAETVRPGVSLQDDWRTFLRNASGKRQRILVTGSFYFIGELQSFVSSWPSP